MKTVCVILFLFLILCLSPAWSRTAKNIAYQDDHVRITLIDDGAVRLEYSPEGKFIDDCSQIAVIRDYAPVDYKICNSSKKVRILTGAMTITYRKGKEPFSASNLSITSVSKESQPFVWKPEIKDTANLKGTYYSLDMY